MRHRRIQNRVENKITFVSQVPLEILRKILKVSCFFCRLFLLESCMGNHFAPSHEKLLLRFLQVGKKFLRWVFGNPWVKGGIHFSRELKGRRKISVFCELRGTRRFGKSSLIKRNDNNSNLKKRRRCLRRRSFFDVSLEGGGGGDEHKDYDKSLASSLPQTIKLNYPRAHCQIDSSCYFFFPFE